MGPSQAGPCHIQTNMPKSLLLKGIGGVDKARIARSGSDLSTRPLLRTVVMPFIE